MKLLKLSAVCAVALWAEAVLVNGDVTWRVSVKFINDASNQRPTNGTITNQAAIQAQIDFANALPTLAGRGVQLELTEVLDVFGASKWFSVTPDDKARPDLEKDAKNDPVKYHWSTDAINIYLNNESSGGTTGDVIFLGTSNKPWVFIHEIGHFMGLCHTQGCSCGSCSDAKGALCSTKPDSDGIDDTIEDLQCWTQDNIANNSFGKNYANLSATQQQEVDNVFFNIMSYHGNRSLFTTLQLDTMCDTSNTDRDNVSHNNLIFTDTSSVGVLPTGQSKLQPVGGPYAQLKNAIDAAFGGDVVLLRPGAYTESREIRKSITLRAVRRDVLTAGNAVIRAN